MGIGTLIWRNLWRRKVRTVLTVGSLIVAIFLLCLLRTLVTTLGSATQAASSQRLIVQSAVSLFVDLPLSYQSKIEAVPGIEEVVKWQWFGGYFQEPQNQFAQFAIDPEETLAVYPEMEIVDGSVDAFLANRRGCIIGQGLANRFGWQLGDTIPLIPTIFPHPDGAEEPWEFEVEAVYSPTEQYFDNSMLLFQWDYFQKTVESGPLGTPGCGTYIIKIGDVNDATAVMAATDALFENGPQRVQTTSEAEFQMQFITMFGNVPFFVSTIGGGVLIAILLAVVNTMLMAGREQTHDIGIMKALGFQDGTARVLLIAQSMALCAVGGALGIAAAWGAEPAIAAVMGAMFPGYNIQMETYALAVAVSLGIGLIAGITPALRAGNLRPVAALASEE